MQIFDDLFEIAPWDKRQFLYEVMNRLFYAMQEIKPEDFDDESLDQFMTADDSLSNAIYTIELRGRKQKKNQKLLTKKRRVFQYFTLKNKFQGELNTSGWKILFRVKFP